MKRNFLYDLKNNISLQDLLNLLKSNLRIVFFLTLIFYLFPISYFIYTNKEYRGKLRIKNFPALVNEQYCIEGFKTLDCADLEFNNYKPKIFEKELYINAIIKEINSQNFLSKISNLTKDNFEQINRHNIKNDSEYLKSNLLIKFDPKEFNYVDIYVTNKDFEYVKSSLFHIEKELKKTINAFQQNLISSEIVILKNLIFELVEKKDSYIKDKNSKSDLEKLIFQILKKVEFAYRKDKSSKSDLAAPIFKHPIKLEKIIFDLNSKDYKFVSSKNNYTKNIISLISVDDIKFYNEYLNKFHLIRDEQTYLNGINIELVNNKKRLSIHNKLLKSGEKFNLFLYSEPLFFDSNYRKFNYKRLVTSLFLCFLMANLITLLLVFFDVKQDFKNKNSQ